MSRIISVELMDLHELSKATFEAYNAGGDNPGHTFDGRPVPKWEELTDDVRLKWSYAARRASSLTARHLVDVIAKASRVK